MKSEHMAKVDEAFQELIFYELSETKEIPNDRTNIFRADLFSLFPNVVEVEFLTKYHPLNLLSLLSVLEEAVISPSFKKLRISEQHDGLIANDFFDGGWSLVEQYAAKNFAINMESARGFAVIVIEPLS